MTDKQPVIDNDEYIETVKSMLFGEQAFKRFNAKERDTLNYCLNKLEQEPCEVCVSRQAVIAGIREYWHDEYYQRVPITEEREDLINDVINHLPPVTPKQRWIPVSERLPEVNQKVLVTSYGRTCYAMMISIDGNNGYPVFRLQDSLKERVVCETTEHGEFTKGRIKAWMPLPEPYKEGESEKRCN